MFDKYARMKREWVELIHPQTHITRVSSAHELINLLFKEAGDCFATESVKRVCEERPLVITLPYFIPFVKQKEWIRHYVEVLVGKSSYTQTATICYDNSSDAYSSMLAALFIFIQEADSVRPLDTKRVFVRHQDNYSRNDMEQVTMFCVAPEDFKNYTRKASIKALGGY